ncbi:22983_t:CDS:2 [Gigaspora margarita]|uniref:22983_t:CDS:1 n=1 Tax=Gigaspora margarita TaxID=4874 RepID=A0ABM8VZ14_GIGMA|nr:22983_t:CDS:2 [Gigaspora margarita]
MYKNKLSKSPNSLIILRREKFAKLKKLQKDVNLFEKTFYNHS